MSLREQKTCEDHANDERCRADEQKDCGQPGEFGDHFFGTLSDFSESYEKSVRYYLYCVDTCNPANNDEVICCGCDEVETGCNDPEKCPNRRRGVGYPELAREMLRTSSMRYVPFKGEWVDGAVLVYNENALPDNQPSDCDPCAEDVIGAFEMVPLADLVTARVEAILKERGL